MDRVNQKYKIINMVKNKLSQLRSLFQESNINGYILSTQDEYLSEYPPACSKRLEYLSGFSGSNGLVIILENTILFFTDGRYFTQATQELDSNLFQIFDQKLLVNFTWENYIHKDEVIAYDPEIFTNRSLLLFKTFNLKPIQGNLVDKIWINRPPKPSSKIYNYYSTFTGEKRSKKFTRCRNFLEIHNAEALVITNPEILCWLFNIRGLDIEFSPIVLANGLITKNKACLFADISRLDSKLSGITIMPKDSFVEVIQNQQGKILFDDNLCSKYISDLIKNKEHQLIVDPCLLWKACKNPVEINNMIEGHVVDAVAVIEFLSFLTNNDLNNYSEYDLGVKLTELRAKGCNYIADSFPTIIGFKENGAIIHYRALQNYSKKIIGDGLLLIDSGGQYLGATTDITRVFSIGKPKNNHQVYYTKILKGHLALAMIKFPKASITGANLDILARQFLWQGGDDYPHGTGHGVGSFSSVHEGPQNISLSSYNIKFASGMVVSNEPGFYVAGDFGIRIENLMYVKNSTSPGFLEFNMLTLVPYEKNLIKWKMLNNNELEYLFKYYKLIEKRIMPHLSKQARKWLQNQLKIY